MDGQLCNGCGAVNPAYIRFCEKCNTDLLAEPENSETDEQGTMFQSAYLNDEPTKSRTVDNVLMGIVAMITIYAGGYLWFIAAAVIHFIFREQEKSWLFFIVPWVLLQIIAFALWR